MKRIVSVAVKTRDGLIHSLPAPKRHHHVLQSDWFIECGESVQGFLTDSGHFVDRTLGMVIAREAGQLIRDETDPKKYQGPLLFSEDLW